jgi:hypothetical protein
MSKRTRIKYEKVKKKKKKLVSFFFSYSLTASVRDKERLSPTL